MKINSCLLIAIATAVALTSSFTDAKRDRRDVAAAAVPENVDDPTELWNHKHHQQGKNQHNHQHGHQCKHPHRKCQTQTVVVFAPCTTEAQGDIAQEYEEKTTTKIDEENIDEEKTTTEIDEENIDEEKTTTKIDED
ncbi:hypothetical protein CPC16_011470, partial [Podila verticillata]